MHMNKLTNMYMCISVKDIFKDKLTKIHMFLLLKCEE